MKPLTIELSELRKAIGLQRAKVTPTSWTGTTPTSYTLELLVQRIPNLEEYRFDNRDGLWYAEKLGIVQFFSWSGPENEGGYCGDHYPIRDRQGKRVVLKGPWSASAGLLNAKGFGPCVEAHLTEDPEAFERGYTFFAGAVTLEMAKLACELIRGWEMVKIGNGSYIQYKPQPFREAFKSWIKP